MESVAGPCEWCGSSQLWTVIDDVVYECCVMGCLPLELPGFVPPAVPKGDVAGILHTESVRDVRPRAKATNSKQSVAECDDSFFLR